MPRDNGAPISSVTDQANKARSTGPSLRLGKNVSLTEVEKSLAENASWISDPGPAYVDLEESVYFDIVGLLRLLALVAQRQEAGGHTRFRLPDDAAARHVLRMWRFPRALSAVTLTPLRLLVDADDLVYFGERWPRPQGLAADVTSPEASVLAYLVERQYFGLSPYTGTARSPLERVMESETARWGSYALSQLLTAVIPGPATDIARVIVPEMITNTLSYSAPKVAVLGSQLDLMPHRDTDASPALTIALWADGPSIVGALETRLPPGTSVRSRCISATEEFEVDPPGWPAGTPAGPAGSSPTAAADILLASLYSGGRMVNGAAAGRSSADAPAEADFWLFALYRTAIDTFGGSVEVRTERSAIFITKPGSSERYRVHVTADRAAAPLAGNIVIVRLPVSNA
jgi:hypothetical protein